MRKICTWCRWILISFLLISCELLMFVNGQVTALNDANSTATSANCTSHVVQIFEYESYHYLFHCFNITNLKTVEVETNNLEISGLLVDNVTLPIARRKFFFNANGTADISIKAGHLGITTLSIFVSSADFTEVQNSTVVIKVLRKITLFDKLAVFVLGPLVLLNKCAFGAKIELRVLKRIVTQPVELTLCLISQFVFVPLVAIFLGFICKIDDAMALALLVSAACPGGGGGYVFSFLIDGDITLAITASLVSTLTALVAMPSVIGIYALVVKVPNEIKIPYLDIVLMLLAIATPISSGMFIRRRWPNFAKKLVKIIHPLSLFLIAGGFAVVLVTGRYVLYGPKIGFLLSLLLPLSGFIIATCLARCFSLNWSLSKAVGLESGLKNTFLGVAVIQLSFPQPQADLASILIIMVTIGQVVVSMMWYVLYLIKKRLQKTLNKERNYAKVLQDNDSDESFETELFLGQK